MCRIQIQGVPLNVCKYWYGALIKQRDIRRGTRKYRRNNLVPLTDSRQDIRKMQRVGSRADSYRGPPSSKAFGEPGLELSDLRTLTDPPRL